MSDIVGLVDDSNFEAEVLNSDQPVLVDFTATWCQPCKALAPKVEAVAKDFAGRAKVVKLDIDASRKTAMAYNIRSVPTLLVFSGGAVKGSLLGNVDQRKVAALVEGAF